MINILKGLDKDENFKKSLYIIFFLILKVYYLKT